MCRGKLRREKSIKKYKKQEKEGIGTASLLGRV
jgi:hypothetical protein